MDILFVTPEVSPFARAGGLGDVAHFLPRALSYRGHRLWVITPKYQKTEDAGLPLELREAKLQVPISRGDRIAQIFSVKTLGAVEVIFVGCDDLYNRPGLYGNEFGDYEDNAERFIFFSRAVMECIKFFDLKPDVIHAHDWPSGLVPFYVKTLYKSLPNLSRTATVFTFHNLGSQGIFWHYDYALTGLGWDLFTPDYLEFHGQFNLTKAGLVSADLITTVSRKYAEEALSPEYGCGLEGVLRVRQADLFSALNGVDYKVWDPRRDPGLAANFSVEQLGPKALCRDDLAKTFGLDMNDLPIVAVISRLLDRKGLDIITAWPERLLSLPMKMVFMGTGEDKYQVLLSNLAAAHPGRLGFELDYDLGLLHRIIAGADIFLMPSRYEPCGLEQLYALKYGTIPVVRATGGLDDTVIDVLKEPDAGTGFKFQDYNPETLYQVLAKAVDFYQEKVAWTEMMHRGMVLNFSWDKAAASYEKLYHLAKERADRR